MGDITDRVPPELSDSADGQALGIPSMRPRDLLRPAAKMTAAGLDLLGSPGRGVVVLIYHRIGAGTDSSVDLPVELFCDHLDWLGQERPVVTLDSALEALAEDVPEGPDPVVITFDDGTADFVEVALPALVDRGMPATLYLATAMVGGGSELPPGTRPISWAALGDAVSTGMVTVGSHTHGHVLMDRCPIGVIEDELDRSIDLIRENLAVDPAHFAYPKAIHGSQPARAAVRERFRSAAVAGTRPNPYGKTDPYLLSRSPIQRADASRWFRRKVRGGMAIEDRVRVRMNRIRYRGAAT